MSSSSVNSQSRSTSSQSHGASRSRLEKDLGDIDRQLLGLIQTVRRDSPLFNTLSQMEGEIKGMIQEMKNQSRNSEMKAALRKLEDELKGLKDKEGKNDLSEKEKKALDSLQVQVEAVTQQLTMAQQAEEAALKETSSLGGISAKSEVSKTVQLIQKMCESIQVGTVGGVTFTSIEMKNTTEVPSYFMNANLTITPDASGKMTIQFSNMTAEQQVAAIAAIEQHPELLLDLLNRISIERIQIGEQSVTLPTAEAEEGRGEQGRGGGDQQREQEDREGEARR